LFLSRRRLKQFVNQRVEFHAAGPQKQKACREKKTRFPVLHPAELFDDPLSGFGPWQTLDSHPHGHRRPYICALCIRVVRNKTESNLMRFPAGERNKRRTWKSYVSDGHPI